MVSLLPTTMPYTISDKRGIEAKPYRPKTLGEAKRLISEVFERQGWDERSRGKYLEMKGVNAKDVNKLDLLDARMIISDMERARMVIFAD